MTPIEKLEEAIEKEVPDTWTRLRRAATPEGMWWLDAKRDDHFVTVQWSKKYGFGVSASAPEEGYGEGPEETFTDYDRVTWRVIQLLKEKSHTTPHQAG